MKRLSEASEEETPLKENGPALKRLRCACFPATIAALPHVIRTIDTFLMAPEEATIEAANTRQFKWLRNLLEKYGREVLQSAIISSARHGYIQTVRVLMLEVIGTQGGKLDFDSTQILTFAAVAAAGKGYLAVVELLFLKLDFDNRSSSEENGEYPRTLARVAWLILDEAAANGHLEVVQFVAKHTTQDDFLYDESEAMEKAVSGGHVDVVRFLLQLEKFPWDYVKALNQAIDLEKNVIAELIYQGYPKNVETSFFSRLAQEGNLEAIKYLHHNGHYSPEFVDDAFLKAACFGRTSLVEFLLDKGSISSDAFDAAFEGAASSGVLETVKVLYDQHRVSQSSLQAAFESTNNAQIVKLLYANTCLSVESISIAFKNAGRCGHVDGTFYYPREDQLEILNLLSTGPMFLPVWFAKFSREPHTFFNLEFYRLWAMIIAFHWVW